MATGAVFWLPSISPIRPLALLQLPQCHIPQFMTTIDCIKLSVCPEWLAEKALNRPDLANPDPDSLAQPPNQSIRKFLPEALISPPRFQGLPSRDAPSP
jgi:hypothetical protein